MIARVDLAAINQLRDTLPQFAHPPLCHLHHLNSDQRRHYWLNQISQSLADESSIALSASIISPGISTDYLSIMIRRGTAKSPAGTSGNVKHLAVTTDDYAGTEILHELIDELTRSLGKRETQCVTCRVQSSELAATHALEQSGFLLMDTLLDFVFDFSRGPNRRDQPISSAG